MLWGEVDEHLLLQNVFVVLNILHISDIGKIIISVVPHADHSYILNVVHLHPKKGHCSSWHLIESFEAFTLYGSMHRMQQLPVAELSFAFPFQPI